VGKTIRIFPNPPKTSFPVGGFDELSEFHGHRSIRGIQGSGVYTVTQNMFAHTDRYQDTYNIEIETLKGAPLVNPRGLTGCGSRRKNGESL